MPFGNDLLSAGARGEAAPIAVLLAESMGSRVEPQAVKLCKTLHNFVALHSFDTPK
ncbi:hypothetical protein LIMNO130_60176 [Limnobacter sp. 130]|nr:hypothetical protein LIMNO130_60176 [Limnobacter sp. 130]